MSIFQVAYEVSPLDLAGLQGTHDFFYLGVITKERALAIAEQIPDRNLLFHTHDRRVCKGIPLITRQFLLSSEFRLPLVDRRLVD